MEFQQRCWLVSPGGFDVKRGYYWGRDHFNRHTFRADGSTYDTAVSMSRLYTNELVALRVRIIELNKRKDKINKLIATYEGAYKQGGMHL